MGGAALLRLGFRRTVHPSSLFALGEWGWALDPTDLTKCWQTITGTTPVVNPGDPVGRIDDISGNAKHFAASANDTTRPAWQSAGALYFDGINDQLRRSEAGLYAANGMTIVARVNGPNTLGIYMLVEASGTDVDPMYALLHPNAIAGGYNRYFIRDNNNVVILNDNSGIAVWDNAWHTIIIEDSGLNITTTVGGVAGSLNSYLRSGPVTLSRTSIGALWRTTVSNWANGQIGRIVAIDRPLTAQEKIDMTTWVQAGA